MGVLLIGSTSRGMATYRSDIDLLVVLKDGDLHFGRVQNLRDHLDHALADVADTPLPIHANFVLPSVIDTKEPAMQRALLSAIILWDPSLELYRQLKRTQ